MGGDSVPGEVTLFQDAFSHFDKTKCGMLSTKMLGQLLRFVGENPSDAEVQVTPFKKYNFPVIICKAFLHGSKLDNLHQNLFLKICDVFISFLSGFDE